MGDPAVAGGGCACRSRTVGARAKAVGYLLIGLVMLSKDQQMS
jgi:hypothetical protein